MFGNGHCRHIGNLDPSKDPNFRRTGCVRISSIKAAYAITRLQSPSLDRRRRGLPTRHVTVTSLDVYSGQLSGPEEPALTQLLLFHQLIIHQAALRLNRGAAGIESFKGDLGPSN